MCDVCVCVGDVMCDKCVMCVCVCVCVHGACGLLYLCYPALSTLFRVGTHSSTPLFSSSLSLHTPNQVVKRQVVANVEFTGKGFEATPSEIVFRDLEPGVVYRRRVTLTNISFGFNTFKILDLPLEVRGGGFLVRFDLAD